MRKGLAVLVTGNTFACTTGLKIARYSDRCFGRPLIWPTPRLLYYGDQSTPNYISRPLFEFVMQVYVTAQRVKAKFEETISFQEYKRDSLLGLKQTIRQQFLKKN